VSADAYARAFGAEAEAYERGRPGWPVEAVDAVGLPRNAVVLDLAPLAHLVPDGVWGSRGGGAKQNRFETGEWRAAFGDGPFGPFEQASFEHEQRLTRAELVDYYASISWVAALPADERSRELARFAAALDRDEYRRSLRTDVHWARLA
jgi:hypothetical protein